MTLTISALSTLTLFIATPAFAAPLARIEGTDRVRCSPACVGNTICQEGTCVPLSGTGCATGGGGANPCGAGFTCVNGACQENSTEPATAPAATPSAPPIVGSPTTLQDPFGKQPIQKILGSVIKIFTGVSGSLALLMFVYGGFLWLTSAGNAEQVTKGRKVMVWAAIGLLVIFGSYAALSTIFGAIGATSTPK